MAKVPEEKINEVRTAVNLVHYIGQFVNLKKAGQNYKGLCPFHSEKTPSFVVSPEKQIFHCFGCGKGGNVFSFIMDHEKLTFFEALHKAADFGGILLPKNDERSEEEASFFQQLYHINHLACEYFERALNRPANQQWLNYFLNRKISPATIRKFRLGYAEDSFDQLLNFLKSKNCDLNHAKRLGLIQERERDGGYYDKFRHRIIFPFQNQGGKIVGFGGRKLREEQQPKYLNSPESPVYKKSQLLYGLNHAITAIREKGYAVLVEGYFDLLRLSDSGFHNVVASSGTALAEDQVKLLRRFTGQIYIAFDGDDAGVKAALRSAQIIEKSGLNAFIISFPAEDDPDTFVLNNGLAAFEALIGEKQSPLEFRMQNFREAHESPDMNIKEKFISEVMEHLAEIPDQVKTGLYLHQLAEEMQINESMLVGQFNRLQRAHSRRRILMSRNTNAEKTPPKEAPVSLRSGNYKAEAGVLALLMTGQPEIRNLILERITLELFENEPMRRLFEYVIQELEEHGQVQVSQVMESFQDDEPMKQTVSEVALTEIQDARKFARDCIFQLKIRRLEKQSQELKAQIKKEQTVPEAVLHYNQELIRIRKEMNALSRERQKE